MGGPGRSLGEARIIHQGRFLEFVEHPFDGGQWEYIRRRGRAGVVFIVAVTDEQELLVVKQYRVPLGADVWELPAGVRDQQGEDLLESAGRELIEETGYQAHEVSYLTRGPVAAGSSATIGDYVLAMGLEHVGAEGGDEFFPITVQNVALGSVLEWCLERVEKDELVDPRIIAGAVLAQAFLERS